MPTSPSIYQIKVTLADFRPPIWRRFLVKDTITLAKLHDILQIVMGWENYHLHQFTIHGAYFGDPQDDELGELGIRDEKKYKLHQLFGREGIKFTYEYDFGDRWEHELVIEKILPFEPGVKYPRCIAGERACPPEDVGGVGGYHEFLQAIADPTHPQHDRMLEWIGEDFDPEQFDLEKTNRLLHKRPQQDKPDDEAYAQWIAHLASRFLPWQQTLSQRDIELLEALPVRRDMITFLTYIKENKVTGTPSTGNLPLKDVRAVCARFVNPPILDNQIGKYTYKLRSENDVSELVYIHTIAHQGLLIAGGLGKRLSVTVSGETFLNYPAPLQVGILLLIWWRHVDWRITYPLEGLRRGWPLRFKETCLEQILTLSPGQFVPFDTFADRMVAETGLTWPSADQSFVKETLRWVIKKTVVQPLESFNVLECTYKPTIFLDRDVAEIRLTPLGKDFMMLLKQQ